MVLFDNLEDLFQDWRSFNEYSKALVTLATAVGTLTLVYFFLRLVYSSLQGIRIYICHQCCCSKRNFKAKYGEWAVISGSTDGIGLAMARELARDGHSIVVIGRNEEKLANTKASLEQEPNVGEVVTVKIDLSDQSPENYERIRAQIDPDNRDIGILINNAGVFSDTIMRFNNYDMEDLRKCVNVNVLATVYLTRMIMPGMIQRAKGLVLNVSSTIGALTIPYLGVYGPTKAFVDSFSRGLQAEYSSHPVDIINLTPGAVYTKLFTNVSKIPRPSFFSPTPEDYARCSLNAISSGVAFISGTPFHAIGYKLLIFFESLGVLPKLMGLNLSLTAKNNKLSPVMKRKIGQAPEAEVHLEQREGGEAS